MDALGVERAVAMCIAPKGNMEKRQELNDQVIQVVGLHPERLIPMGSMHPLDGADAFTFPEDWDYAYQEVEDETGRWARTTA